MIAVVVRAYYRSSPCLAARRRRHTEAAAQLCRSSPRHCRSSGSSSSMILLDLEHSDLTVVTVHVTFLSPRACQRAARGRVSWTIKVMRAAFGTSDPSSIILSDVLNSLTFKKFLRGKSQQQAPVPAIKSTAGSTLKLAVCARGCEQPISGGQEPRVRPIARLFQLSGMVGLGRRQP